MTWLLTHLFLVDSTTSLFAKVHFQCNGYLVCCLVQSTLDGWNTDGSFTMANSNSFLKPYEIHPNAQENKYLRKFSYLIVKLYVECTH